ncbi:HET-domain-containing protein [Pilatotrama ljubarskyi]|nr:HET-domain-containing protein [Pilatotrama ljubarskyi]
MWLLNTRTAELRQFASSQGLRYAIISHVWQQEPKEQTFHEVRAILVRCKESGEDPLPLLSRKIQDCCRMAARAGHEWLWLDTCCIDQHSSAELSEAINSMFAWYSDAQVCYVYLHDVGDDEDPSVEGSAFRRGVWHTRGWTLQELLAPGCVIFLSKTWHTLGSKHSLAPALSQVSGIKPEVLTRDRVDWIEGVSVAERMSWAAHRKTTRVEDRAYSLMGIFGINMPTIYGEGPRAFMRLQEEILQRIPDQSIFAWGRIHPNFLEAVEEMRNEPPADEDKLGDDDEALERQARLEVLLAPSPAEFAFSAGIKVLSVPDLQSKYGVKGRVPQYTLTSYGMLAQLPFSTDFVDTAKSHPTGVASDDGTLAETPATRPVHAAVLGCTDKELSIIVLLLRPTQASSHQYAVGEYIGDARAGKRHYYRAALYPKIPRTTKYKDKDGTLKEHVIPFASFPLKELYIRHDYATLHLGQAPFKGGAEEHATAGIVYTFHVPQWALNRMEARHWISVRPPCEDGLLFSVPYEVNWGKLEHAVSSAQLFDSVRKEIITLRIGVGCACSELRGTPQESAAINSFWIDARIALVAKPGYTQSYGEPLASEAARAPCGKVHMRTKGKGREGDNQRFAAAFGAPGREVRIAVEARRGFEPARGPVERTYSVMLDFADINGGEALAENGPTATTAAAAASERQHVDMRSSASTLASQAGGLADGDPANERDSPTVQTSGRQGRAASKWSIPVLARTLLGMFRSG